jgi:hypothetical protein
LLTRSPIRHSSDGAGFGVAPAYSPSPVPEPSMALIPPPHQHHPSHHAPRAPVNQCSPVLSGMVPSGPSQARHPISSNGATPGQRPSSPPSHANVPSPSHTDAPFGGELNRQVHNSNLATNGPTVAAVAPPDTGRARKSYTPRPPRPPVEPLGPNQHFSGSFSLTAAPGASEAVVRANYRDVSDDGSKQQLYQPPPTKSRYPSASTPTAGPSYTPGLEALASLAEAQAPLPQSSSAANVH